MYWSEAESVGAVKWKRQTDLLAQHSVCAFVRLSGGTVVALSPCWPPFLSFTLPLYFSLLSLSVRFLLFNRFGAELPVNHTITNYSFWRGAVHLRSCRVMTSSVHIQSTAKSVWSPDRTSHKWLLEAFIWFYNSCHSSERALHQVLDVATGICTVLATINWVQYWCRVIRPSSHLAFKFNQIEWGWGQVLLHQTQKAISLWTLLCGQGRCHGDTGRAFSKLPKSWMHAVFPNIIVCCSEKNVPSLELRRYCPYQEKQPQTEGAFTDIV